MKELSVGDFVFQIFVGDITEVTADAIVSAANSLGHMRGGVSQAIRHKGGDIIEKEARKLSPIGLGNAVATTAGSLKARWVIHAPTMRDPVEISSVSRIRSASRAALCLAGELGAESIAYPALGTGVGEVTFEQGADAIVVGILEARPQRGNVRMVKLVARTPAMCLAFEVAVDRAIRSAAQFNRDK